MNSTSVKSAARFGSRGIVDTTTGDCSCFYGTAYIDANGICRCDNSGGIGGSGSTINTNNIPMPTTQLPVGYHWEFNATLRKWIPVRDAVTEPVVVANNISGAFQRAVDWAKANPLMALAVVGGGYYLVKKKK